MFSKMILNYSPKDFWFIYIIKQIVLDFSIRLENYDHLHYDAILKVK